MSTSATSPVTPDRVHAILDRWMLTDGLPIRTRSVYRLRDHVYRGHSMLEFPYRSASKADAHELAELVNDNRIATR